jgi:hypothetical protein
VDFSEDWPLQNGFQERLLSARHGDKHGRRSAPAIWVAAAELCREISFSGRQLPTMKLIDRRKRIIVATPARPSKKGVAATFELDGTAETTGTSVKHFTLAIMIRDFY